MADGERAILLPAESVDSFRDWPRTSSNSKFSQHDNRSYSSIYATIPEEPQTNEQDEKFGSLIEISNVFGQQRRPSVFPCYFQNKSKTSNTNGSGYEEHGADQRYLSFVQRCIFPNPNGWALKIYGTERKVMKEIQRCLEFSYIIHPYSNFRMFWDLFMLVLLILNMFTLPLLLAFFTNHNNNGWLTFSFFNDTFFILDCILNFRTGMPAHPLSDEVTLDPKLIREKYLKGWFVIDLLSSVPVDYLVCILKIISESGSKFLDVTRALKTLRIIKLFSLMKLFRVSRMLKYGSTWDNVSSLAGNAVSILNLVFAMVVISHWNGCLMFLVPSLLDFPQDCWVVLEGLQDSHWYEQYSWAFFRALSLMLCIGYGNSGPQNQLDLWLVIVSMISGAASFALFIGHTTNLIMQVDSSRRQFVEKVKQVENYLTYQQLPLDLRVRVRDFYDTRYNGRLFEERTILQELNHCLKKEILDHNCLELVSSVPFFKDCGDEFLDELAEKLRFEVFQAQDSIFKFGVRAHCMYFIKQGTVDIRNQDNDTLYQLRDGAYFGEVCLISKCRRSSNAVATGNCFLYSLHAEDFLCVISLYDEAREKLHGLAAASRQNFERLN